MSRLKFAIYLHQISETLQACLLITKLPYIGFPRMYARVHIIQYDLTSRTGDC